MTVQVKIFVSAAILSVSTLAVAHPAAALEYDDPGFEQYNSDYDSNPQEIYPLLSRTEPDASRPVTTSETSAEPIPEPTDYAGAESVPTKQSETTPESTNQTPAEQNCLGNHDQNCVPKSVYWPMVLSGCVLAATVLLFIVINLLGRKKS